MNSQLLIITAISASIMMTTGCSEDSQTDNVASPPPPAPAASAPKTTSTMQAAAETIKEAVDDVKEVAPKIDESMVEEANSIMEQVREALANNDFDLARILLEKLAGMKSMLPESVQSQIDSLQSMLSTQQAAADGAAGMEQIKDKLPGMGN